MPVEPVSKTYSVGVMVARFQLHELHAGHCEVIKYILGKHKKMIIILGVSDAKCTRNNPLDVEARINLIKEHFPNEPIMIFPVCDMRSDEDWSKQIDKTIKTALSVSESAVLYGSRDSFISHYSGSYDTQELTCFEFWSATKIRQQIATTIEKDKGFRAGVVWATYNRYPSTIPTVDALIYSEDGTRILLAKKPGESKYRFVGGFSDPSDESYEASIKRELAEETGHGTYGEPEYLGSFKVDDWRYRGEKDQIKTILFAVKHLWGGISPSDDIEELKWFDEIELRKKAEDLMMPEHLFIYRKLFPKE